MPLFSTAEIQ